MTAQATYRTRGHAGRKEIYIYIDIYAIGGSLGPVGRDPQGARVNHAIGYTHSRVHTIYKKKEKKLCA